MTRLGQSILLKTTTILDLRALMSTVHENGTETSESRVGGLVSAAAFYRIRAAVDVTPACHATRLFSILFTSCRVVVLGFGLRGDLMRLAESYPRLLAPLCSAAVNLVDLQERASAMAGPLHEHKLKQRQPRSLKHLCEQILEGTLDKQEQCSDWSRRPLTERQQVYAAQDVCPTPTLPFCLPCIVAYLSHAREFTTTRRISC